MYKNLNDLTVTNLNVSYNNTKDLTDIKRQLSANIPFTKEDVNNGVLRVYDRMIKHCVVITPSGQVWNDLDYFFHVGTHETSDRSYTEFNFTHIIDSENDSEWEDGEYVIAINSNQDGITLSNSIHNNGVQLLRQSATNCYLKKLVAGDGIQFNVSDNYIVVSSYQHNYSEQIFNFSQQNNQIDIANGNIQLAVTKNNDELVDIVNTNIPNANLLSVTIVIYKPNETTFKYRQQVILQKYDIGWFAFSVKKIFNHLFISQPTRIITDYNIE